jgi:xanthine dehydrogenase accessory protein XdhC
MWAARLLDLLEREPCVLVTVAEIHGSAPRAPGSRMLVTPETAEGSIGGGNLEYQALDVARRLLALGRPGSRELATYGLGPALNQCCGGAVTLLYEHVDPADADWLVRLRAAQEAGQTALLVTPLDPGEHGRWVLEPGCGPPSDLPTDAIESLAAASEPVVRVAGGERRMLVERIGRQRLPLALFGAGHVGCATAGTLAPLPFDLTWLDSRPGEAGKAVSSGLRPAHCADPAASVAGFPPATVYVVMTHSHQLDEDICHAVLQRDDFAWLGLIGSATKRKRFVHRLGQRGIPAASLARLHCPLGLSGLEGKRPATIAVALAAQLLRDVVPEAWK